MTEMINQWVLTFVITIFAVVNSIAEIGVKNESGPVQTLLPIPQVIAVNSLTESPSGQAERGRFELPYACA